MPYQITRADSGCTYETVSWSVRGPVPATTLQGCFHTRREAVMFVVDGLGDTVVGDEDETEAAVSPSRPAPDNRLRAALRAAREQRTRTTANLERARRVLAAAEARAARLCPCADEDVVCVVGADEAQRDVAFAQAGVDEWAAKSSRAGVAVKQATLALFA